MRRAKRPAHRMIDEGRARRTNSAHDVMSCADDQSWNVPAFDHVSDETDGLMAEGSVGHEKGEIELGLLELGGQRGRKLVFDLAVRAHSAHERVVKRRQLADGSALRQSRESGAREDDFRILFRHSSDA